MMTAESTATGETRSTSTATGESTSMALDVVEYGINFEYLSNYDQIIDSSYFKPEVIVDFIKDGIMLLEGE